MSRNPKKTNSKNIGVIIILILMMLIFIAGSALMIKLSLDLANQEVIIRSDGSTDITLPAAPEAETTEAPPPETTVPVPEHVVSTATIVSTGDILMHKPVTILNPSSATSPRISPLPITLLPTWKPHWPAPPTATSIPAILTSTAPTRLWTVPKMPVLICF